MIPRIQFNQQVSIKSKAYVRDGNNAATSEFTCSEVWSGFAKEVAPLRGNEKQVADQLQSNRKREFVIDNESQSIDTKTMYIEVDGDMYDMYRCDNYKGDHRYLVIGGEKRG